MPAKFELIAPCFFGCESTANFELRRIGAEDIRVSDGRLTFKGGAEMIAAANLNLRTVERVMLLLNTYTATTFDELFDGVYSIHWEELLPADAAFPVTGSSLNSQLSSVPLPNPETSVVLRSSPSTYTRSSLALLSRTTEISIQSPVQISMSLNL